MVLSLFGPKKPYSCVVQNLLEMLTRHTTKCTSAVILSISGKTGPREVDSALLCRVLHMWMWQWLVLTDKGLLKYPQVHVTISIIDTGRFLRKWHLREQRSRMHSEVVLGLGTEIWPDSTNAKILLIFFFFKLWGKLFSKFWIIHWCICWQIGKPWLILAFEGLGLAWRLHIP